MTEQRSTARGIVWVQPPARTSPYQTPSKRSVLKRLLQLPAAPQPRARCLERLSPLPGEVLGLPWGPAAHGLGPLR
jgi:hypothetical protein